ncbi:hypothetical protein H4219_005806 [Mycoemilia scoparia]|uniref:Uncharacterized protein n=1 Tax=Mycoemilia scoparia TaxID=417184 RepID=A0A9W7ZVZ4_9FUNG|nr:hypothetical protein H4219_005806 [Mycoemilia scoparia]
MDSLGQSQDASSVSSPPSSPLSPVPLPSSSSSSLSPDGSSDMVNWMQVLAPQYSSIQNKLNYTFNAISIVAAGLVLFAYIPLWYYRRQLATRVSLRLAICISIVDLIVNITSFIPDSTQLSAGSGDAAEGSGGAHQHYWVIIIVSASYTHQSSNDTSNYCWFHRHCHP